MPDFLTTGTGRRLAFRRTPGQGPGVVFLGGLRSDMEGTKALHLEAWARAQGRAFLRFDYSGHGQSSGRFEDGCIGDWAADADAAVAALTDGPQVLVGSSMGGWIALLLARAEPARVAGLVGIAAAPDFTARLRAGMSQVERDSLRDRGRIERASVHGAPLVYTRRLIEDGENHLVLTQPIHLPFPLRLLQGMADADVPPSVALNLISHAKGPDIRLTLVKVADHRFSTTECLDLIVAATEELVQGGCSG